jgi:hypothetical protein
MVRPCSAVESLAPAVDAGTCDERELAEYTDALADRIVARNSRALVRVEYDDQSHVRAMCVDDRTGRDVWNARRHAAEELVAMGTIPDGPRCLAGRRVDLNRYAAKLAEVRAAELACGSVMGSRRMKALGSCQKYPSDWIVYDRIGSTRPYLFLKSEGAPVSTASAADTLRRCSRTAWGFEEQSACIQADGFELLTPPRR